MNSKYSLIGIILGILLIILPLTNLISANYVLAAIILILGIILTIFSYLDKNKKYLLVVGILLIIFGLVLLIMPNIYLEFASIIILILAIIIAIFAIYNYINTKEPIPTLIGLVIAVIYAICAFYVKDIIILTAIIGIGLILAGIVKFFLKK